MITGFGVASRSANLTGTLALPSIIQLGSGADLNCGPKDRIILVQLFSIILTDREIPVIGAGVH